MKININPFFFLFIIIFSITKQIKIYLIIMVFAFIHEMSHIIVGKVLKLNVKKFLICPMGFKIEFEHSEIKNIEHKKILIALAGPFTNLAIFILGRIIKTNQTIIYSNLLLAIFNLIPIYPLDGGRILKSILRLTYSNSKADEYFNNITNIFSIVITMFSSIIILKYKNIAIILFIATLWYFVIIENKKYRLRKKIYKIIDKSCNYL